MATSWRVKGLMPRRLLTLGRNFPGFRATLTWTNPSSTAWLSRLLKQRILFCTVLGESSWPSCSVTRGAHLFTSHIPQIEVSKERKYPLMQALIVVGMSGVLAYVLDVLKPLNRIGLKRYSGLVGLKSSLS